MATKQTHNSICMEMVFCKRNQYNLAPEVFVILFMFIKINIFYLNVYDHVKYPSIAKLY